MREREPMGDWQEIDNRLQDPHWYAGQEWREAFERLRAEDPVHWAEDDAFGRHYWFLTRYQDVKRVLADPWVFSSRMDTRVPRSPRRLTPEDRFELGYDPTMMRSDPIVHNLYRQPLNKHFSVPAVRRMAGHVEKIVDEIIADVAGRGECEAVTEIARELPTKVVLRFLGFPEHDWPFLHEAAWMWLSPAEAATDADIATTAREGRTRLLDYCEQFAIARRADPRDDFATVLTNVEIDGDPVSIHELRSYFTTFIGAGLDSTRNAAGLGLWAFLSHPDQKELFLSDPAYVPMGVEEVLRWASPPRTRFRVAAQDVEVGGKQIRNGDWIVLSQSAANGDGEVFDDPGRFDITRSPNPHLAFGEGIHLCLGRNLVRLELSTLFTKVLRTFPDMEIVGTPTWIPDNAVNGLARLDVRYSPVTAE